MTKRQSYTEDSPTAKGPWEVDRAIQSAGVALALIETERAWLDLLDRLGGRDIQEFSGLIQARRDENLRRPAPGARRQGTTLRTQKYRPRSQRPRRGLSIPS
jgi:hypothetical protein